jgi:hypothetical protein
LNQALVPTQVSLATAVEVIYESARFLASE